MSNHELVEKRILELPGGSVFTTSDFIDVTTSENFWQIAHRLAQHLLPVFYIAGS